MKRLFLYPILAALALVCFVGSVFAAEATATPATVNLGGFAKFLADYVVPSLGALIGVGIAYLANLLKTKWNLDIDASQRDSLHAALTNAASLLVQKGVTALDGKTVNVGNPMVAEAVNYVQQAAPGALAHFGLGPDDIAQKLAAKLPQIAPLAMAPVGVAPAA